MICEAGSKRLDGDANILERAVRMCTSNKVYYAGGSTRHGFRDCVLLSCYPIGVAGVSFEEAFKAHKTFTTICYRTRRSTGVVTRSSGRRYVCGSGWCWTWRKL